MTTTDTRTKLHQIAAALKASFPERDEAIDAMLLAFVAKQHVTFLSPPGCAKSAVARCFSDCIVDASYFELLMSRFTVEEDLFGARSLSEMKADRWVRSTDGTMVDAEVAFLDEIWKGGGSILNALLTATNERVYKNGSAGVVKMPLWTVLSASNELPEADLAALYDRFLIRLRLDYVQEDASFDRLLDDDAGRFVPPCTVSMDELRAAHAEAMTIDAPALRPEVKQQLKALRASLAEQGIVVSDRRFKHSVIALRAAAWIEGSKHVELDHLEVLRWTLWSSEDQIEPVAQALAKIDTGVVGDVSKIVDDALRAWSSRPRNAAAYVDQHGALSNAFADAERKVTERCKEGLTRRARAKVEARLAELEAARGQLRSDVAATYGLST